MPTPPGRDLRAHTRAAPLKRGVVLCSSRINPESPCAHARGPVEAGAVVATVQVTAVISVRTRARPR